MISSFLFDFGGTLDSDGGHWLDRFYVIYDHVGLGEIPKPKIKEAFYAADALAEASPEMKTAGFREMMQRHVHWQFAHLGVLDPVKEAKTAEAFCRPSEKILHRNRTILEKLSLRPARLAVISNFYGNVDALCQEVGLTPLLTAVLDSARVGLRKPDPAFYRLALQKLGTPPEETLMVGDSFERDVLPAKSLGMKTCWIIGDRRLSPPDPSRVDYVIHSLEDLLTL